MVTNWRDMTRNLLTSRPRHLSYDVIAEQTGLTVRWLRDFASGKTDNPGVCHVQTLHTYLSRELNGIDNVQ